MQVVDPTGDKSDKQSSVDGLPEVSEVRVICWHCSEINTASTEDRGKPVTCSRCGEFLIVPKDRFAPSVVIGDFVLRDVLGRGGMGTVFLADQRSLDRPCALKILHSDYMHTEVEELMQEARLAAKLNHQNIVQCYAVGEADGIHYYAMEYVSGRTLRQLLDDKWKVPASQAVDVTRQVAVALDYAWKRQRLVHRDIKPENIILTEDNVAKLADLGLARPAHELGEDAMMGSDLRGTPQYICPEHLLGKSMDFRGDMYSLGAVFYECVTGKFPFSGATPEEIVKKHLHEQPTHPTNYTQELHPRLCWVIEKMMAKNPDDRFPDIEALIRELDIVRDLCREEARTTTTGLTSVDGIPTPRIYGQPSAAVAGRTTQQGLRIKAKRDTDEVPAVSPGEVKPAQPRPVAPAPPAKKGGGMALVAVAAVVLLLALGGVAAFVVPQMMRDSSVADGPAEPVTPPAEQPETPQQVPKPPPAPKAVALDGFPVYQPEYALDGALQVVGPADVDGLVRVLGETFKTMHPNATLELTPASHDDALAALSGGKAAFAMVTKPLTKAESEAFRARAEGTAPLTMALTSQVARLVVNPENPLANKGLAWSGLERFWQQVDGDGTWAGLGAEEEPFSTQAVTMYATGAAREILAYRKYPAEVLEAKLEVVADDVAVAAAVARDPAGVGLVVGGEFPDTVKPAAVIQAEGLDGIYGEVEEVRSGQYPLVRPVLLVAAAPVGAELPELQRHFLRHVFSIGGQEAMLKLGAAVIRKAECEQQLANAGLASPENLNVIKAAAEMVLAQSAPVAEVPELQAAYRAMLKRKGAAERTWGDGRFAEAAEAYKKLAEEGSQLMAQREAKSRCGAAQDAAEKAHLQAKRAKATESAADVFMDAYDMHVVARRLFAKGEFIEAEETWQAAGRRFEEASCAAFAAKFEAAIGGMGRDLLTRHGGGAWANVEAAETRAKKAREAGEMTTACAAYEQAMKLVPAAMAAVKADLAKQATGFAESGAWPMAERFAGDWLKIEPDSTEAKMVLRRAISNHGFKPGQTFTNSVGMTFAYCPPGEFVMGSPSNEKHHEVDEALHTVRLTKGFFMGVTEVTEKQFLAVMGKNYKPPQSVDRDSSIAGGPNFPYHTLTWFEARTFCEQLSKKEGKVYRLPTEAEWEYACRAGTKTPYHTGEELRAGTHAHVYDELLAEPIMGPREVGKGAKNAWNLYDMHGNVNEWCADWSAPYPKSGKPVEDPYVSRPPERDINTAKRVVRGGSWADESHFARSANRIENMPATNSFVIGFRVLLEAADVKK